MKLTHEEKKNEIIRIANRNAYVSFMRDGNQGWTRFESVDNTYIGCNESIDAVAGVAKKHNAIRKPDAAYKQTDCRIKHWLLIIILLLL